MKILFHQLQPVPLLIPLLIQHNQLPLQDQLTTLNSCNFFSVVKLSRFLSFSTLNPYLTQLGWLSGEPLHPMVELLRLLTGDERLLEGRIPGRDIEIPLVGFIGEPKKSLLLEVESGELHHDGGEGVLLPIEGPKFVVLGLILNNLKTQGISADVVDGLGSTHDHLLKCKEDEGFLTEQLTQVLLKILPILNLVNQHRNKEFVNVNPQPLLLTPISTTSLELLRVLLCLQKTLVYGSHVPHKDVHLLSGNEGVPGGGALEG